MKRHTVLKLVPHEEIGRIEDSTMTSGRESEHAPVSRERNFLDNLDTMERYVHNSLNRLVSVFAPLEGGRLLDRIAGMNGVSPAVDVYEEGKNLVVNAELPGMDKKDINVRFVDTSLIISGEKKSERSEHAKGYYRIERSTGSFERSITLPDGVKIDQATASFTNGILQIRIPKGSVDTLGRQIKIE